MITVKGSPIFETSVVKDCQYFFRCCSPERSCPKESWQVGPKISMSRKRLLHILSLYLEFRFCCVNELGYVLFIVYFPVFVSLYLSIPLGE